MIYTRIDTYSVILYSTTIRQLLEHFDVPTHNLDEAYKNGYKKTDVKLGDTFVWKSEGLRIECKLDEYDMHQESDSIFDVVWTWLRFYITSEGVDFLDSLHADDDTWNLQILLSSPDFWNPISEAHKVTRCDFAFDYINYEGNEFDRLRKLIASADFDDELSSGGRLYSGNAGGLTYSYRGGKERTIYLGSTSADRMLRIYDKKFQLQDDAGNWDTSKVPDEILQNEIQIDSWHRIELQCRDNFAERYLISCQGDFRFIMGEISAFFDVRKKDGKRIAPLHKIFLWTQRTPIVQNAKCKQQKNEITIVSNWVGEIALSHIVEMIGIIGWDGFRNYLNNSIRSRMKQSLPRRIMYINKINNCLSVMALQEGVAFDSQGNIGDLIKGDDGAFYLGPFPESNKILGPYQKE